MGRSGNKPAKSSFTFTGGPDRPSKANVTNAGGQIMKKVPVGVDGKPMPTPKGHK